MSSTNSANLIDLATGDGISEYLGTRFGIEDPETMLNNLRGKALQAAEAKAAFYAKRTGMELGTPYLDRRTRRFLCPTAPGSDGDACSTPPMPFHVGEEEISLSVSVSYRLKPPK